MLKKIARSIFAALFISAICLGLSGSAKAQTCALRAAPAEDFCAQRYPYAFGNAGDLVIAFRVNSTAKCVDIDFVNYNGISSGKYTYWFTGHNMLSHGQLGGGFYEYGQKITYQVASVNAYTQAQFYVHRGSCDALRSYLDSDFMNPGPGPISGGNWYGTTVRNRP